MNEEKNPGIPAIPEEDLPDSIHIRDFPAELATAGIEPEEEPEILARRDLNQVIHSMLTVGLVTTTVVLLLGFALSIIYRQPLAEKASGFSEILPGLRRGDPESFLDLGLLLLIATPILSNCSLIEFISKRNWRYTYITSLVLLVLALSMMLERDDRGIRWSITEILGDSLRSSTRSSVQSTPV